VSVESAIPTSESPHVAITELFKGWNLKPTAQTPADSTHSDAFGPFANCLKKSLKITPSFHHFRNRLRKFDSFDVSPAEA